jgi:FPC/CPF motif-containing protein YcgG
LKKKKKKQKKSLGSFLNSYVKMCGSEFLYGDIMSNAKFYKNKRRKIQSKVEKLDEWDILKNLAHLL